MHLIEVREWFLPQSIKVKFAMDEWIIWIQRVLCTSKSLKLSLKWRDLIETNSCLQQLDITACKILQGQKMFICSNRKSYLGNHLHK